MNHTSLVRALRRSRHLLESLQTTKLFAAGGRRAPHAPPPNRRDVPHAQQGNNDETFTEAGDTRAHRRATGTGTGTGSGQE